MAGRGLPSSASETLVGGLANTPYRLEKSEQEPGFCDDALESREEVRRDKRVGVRDRGSRNVWLVVLQLLRQVVLVAVERRDERPLTPLDKGKPAKLIRDATFVASTARKPSL